MSCGLRAWIWNCFKSTWILIFRHQWICSPLTRKSSFQTSRFLFRQFLSFRTLIEYFCFSSHNIRHQQRICRNSPQFLYCRFASLNWSYLGLFEEIIWWRYFVNGIQRICMTFTFYFWLFLVYVRDIKQVIVFLRSKPLFLKSSRLFFNNFSSPLHSQSKSFFDSCAFNILNSIMSTSISRLSFTNLGYATGAYSTCGSWY